MTSKIKEHKRTQKNNNENEDANIEEWNVLNAIGKH